MIRKRRAEGGAQPMAKGEHNVILHCMRKATWEERKHRDCWGRRDIAADGFIHCSTAEYFWRVAPNFRDVGEDMVLVCIDEARLKAEVRYEDTDGCGREYPHVYGLINNDAVVGVLPFLRDRDGTYVKNPELCGIQDR
ncbi:MAG: DUF952 domain-containing protein [Candidatus Fimadaptatus sp.]